MDPENVLKLFDSCWFNLEIFKKQSYSSNSEPNPHHQIQENPSKPIFSSLPSSKPMFSSLPSILVRSKSDQTSLVSDFLSPSSVLFTPQLQTILSGKEATQEEESRTLQHIINEEQQRKTKRSGGRRRRRKKGVSKSLTELEFEEVKGFMDLGFVFTEEDKDSRLVEIIPGLQRLGREEDHENGISECSVARPYLSEAWEVLERREREAPLMSWRVPGLNNEVDMKVSLKWWAHTVASTIR